MNDANTSHTDRALRGLRQIASAQLLTQVLSWSLTAVTVHILTPRDYGLVATAGIVTVFAQLLLDGGLAQVLVSHRELPSKLQGAAVSAMLLLSSVLGAAVFGIAPFASSFFRSPPLRAILEVQALYLPITALGVVPIAQLSKRMQFRRLARVRISVGITQGFCNIALAYFGEAYWALIIGTLIGGCVQATMLWLSLDERPVPNLFLGELTPLIRSGSHLIGQRISNFTIENLDLFLLSRMWGPKILGPYSVAKILAHTLHDKLSGVTSQISVPAFAARTEAIDQLRGLIAVVSVTATLVFPLFWIIGVMSQVAFPMIFGIRWIHMVVPFVMFAAILPLRTIYSLLNSSLIGTRRTGVVLKNSLLWLAVLAPFLFLGGFKGADGMAIGWAMAFPIVFYNAMRHIARSFAVDIITLIQPIMTPALCAGAAVLVSEAIFLGLSHHLSPVIILACQSFAAAICYPVLLRHVNHVQYNQTLSFVRRVVRV